MNNRDSIWHLLWQMLRYTPKLYLADSFFWLLIMGLPIIPGLIIREFFNSLTDQSQLNLSLHALIALLCATGLGRIAAIFAGRVTKTQHRFTMSALVQRNLLAQLLDRPGAEPFRLKHGQALSPGELISYFREDVAQIENTVVGTNEVVGAGIFAVVSLVILLQVSVSLTLFVFLPIALIILLLQFAEQRIKHYRRTSRQATQQVTGLIAEMFSTVQAIQVAGAEPFVLNHFRQLNEQRRRLMVRDQVFLTALNSGLENLVNIGTGLILLMAALSLAASSAPLTAPLTVGEFALFIYYLAFVTDFLSFLGGFLVLSKQTEVAFERMTLLLSPNSESASPTANPLVAATPLHLPTLRSHPPALPPIQQPHLKDPLHCLRVHHLTYRYPDSDRGIFDISFSLTRGSLTVITGPLGAGKTTLLRVLLGLLPAQSGVIEWNHQRVEHPDRFLVPPRTAYTPQVPQLFSNTLRENLLLGLEQDDSTLEQAITLAALEPDVAAMPQGLETVIGPRGVRLSGGQQQRSAATRMFVRKPELLIFDDLSSALDIATEQRLWLRLFALRNPSQITASTGWQPTCLVVSHRESVLQQADQVIILEQGMIHSVQFSHPSRNA